MHPAGKILVGLILLLIGLGLFADSKGLGLWRSITGVDWIGSFITVLTGIIPVLLILIGLFIVWLEADELKAGKELSTEKKK